MLKTLKILITLNGCLCPVQHPWNSPWCFHLPATSYSAFFLFFALGSIPTCSCLTSFRQDRMPENRNASGSGRIKQIREQGESTINSQINLASPTQKFKFHTFIPLRVEVLTPYTKTCLSSFSGCDRLVVVSVIFSILSFLSTITSGYLITPLY